MPPFGNDQVVAALADGAYLLLIPFGGKKHIASVGLGEWPSGKVLLSHTFEVGRVDAEPDSVPTLWLGDTCYRMPWLELLKVADFLRLEIPLPVPLGQQVQA